MPLSAVTLSCPLCAASLGHVLCQGCFGLVWSLTTSLAACSVPHHPGAVAFPAYHLTSSPCRVYKNTEELRTRIASGIIAPLSAPTEKTKKEPEAEKKDADLPRDYDPLRVPPRQPAGTRAPSW